MRYVIVLVLVLSLSGVVYGQEYPEPDLPDITAPDEIEIQENESGGGFVGFLESLPFVEWNSNLNGVRSRLEESQIYERPQFVQVVGDAIGFVWWVNNNRDGLLGQFAPLYYNVLAFVGWVLLYVVFYVSTVFAVTVRRIIQDFLNASLRIVSIVSDVIPF